MRVRQSVREKNNGRVCRHSRARVGSFDWDKKRLSLLSKAEHLKIVSSSSAGTKKETNSTNEKKKRGKKSQSHGDDAQRDGLDEQSVFLVRPAFSGFRDRVFFSRFHFHHAGRRFFSFFVFFFLFFHLLLLYTQSDRQFFFPKWVNISRYVCLGSWLFYEVILSRALFPNASPSSGGQKRTPPRLEKREIRRPDPPPKCVRSALVFLSPWEDDFFARVLPSVLLLHKNSSSFFCCYFRRNKERSDNKNCVVIVERTKKNEYWV